LVDRLIKRTSECEIGERGRKGVNRVVESVTEVELSE